MARPKKTAPVETPKEFDLFAAEAITTVETPVVAAYEEPAVEEPVYEKEWKCTDECPHYTRASKECQECWEKGHAL